MIIFLMFLALTRKARGTFPASNGKTTFFESHSQLREVKVINRNCRTRYERPQQAHNSKVYKKFHEI